MADLNVGDIQQQYHKNIIMYKGVPTFVIVVADVKEVVVKNLVTGKDNVVKFNLNDFKAHKDRIGMVNHGASCAYVSRIPVRKMGIGINAGNCNIISLQELHSYNPALLMKEISSFTVSGIAKAMLNEYPSFKEARDEVFDADEGCIIRAFDRQFAISTSKSIYYKGALVGTVTKRAAGVRDIRFSEGNGHLEQLL